MCRNMERIIKDVRVDLKYDLTSTELEKLRRSDDLVLIIGNAFRYGYALGQRAERKNKQKAKAL